jgi:hypothetical protein
MEVELVEPPRPAFWVGEDPDVTDDHLVEVGDDNLALRSSGVRCQQAVEGCVPARSVGLAGGGRRLAFAPVPFAGQVGGDHAGVAGHGWAQLHGAEPR